MARSMLSEYNVSDIFLEEVINTSCHASNRLYCHRLLKKTPYELLIGRKLNTSYFRVFSCKCYILKKGTRFCKFQKKCDEKGSYLVTPPQAKIIDSTTRHMA